MSYYIRGEERDGEVRVVDENEKVYSKHKTRLSASNSLYKRMVKEAFKKRKKII